MDNIEKKSFRYKRLLYLIPVVLVGLVMGMYALYRVFIANAPRTSKVLAFLRQPGEYQDWVIPALTRCGDAPFIMPTTGMIGFLWGDSFRPGHHHQGVDIFSGAAVGETPIYAAYGGYLSRLPDWKSTVIIRIPADPLQTERQIWTYYTHMADRDGNSLIVEVFPPGSTEIFVPAGTLLGYQGNYSGNTNRPTGIHLHFSIVKDDGMGKYMNELEIENTIDPSPYFGLQLNGYENKEQIPLCPPE
ncbi:MAG: M23 family metallopeptidase [Brevefilum sp.]